VRGYRIELDEIEAALAAQNEVAQAVAMVREDQPNDKQIVAYVVADPKKIFDMPKVRQHLIQALPGYMIPAALVRLEKFPLTTSGKLDRKALPPPEEDAYARPQYEAPRGEIESTIARIWAEMLKIERVGREDNFFELGGHSLLAVSVIERMRREGLNVDTWMLFVRPTVAALAGDLKGKPKLIVVPKNQIPDFGRRRNQPSEGLEFWL
jgi:arthrofactin-type cyclic lipopeptide synthetase B